MTQQLGLDLPARTALERDAFLVSPSNALAMGMIDNWPDWADGKLLITGPKGAGKTHLTHVWADQSGARIVSANSLRVADVPDLAQNHIAVEDVPNIANDPDCQTALFHLHNLVLAEGHSLMLTGTGPVQDWGLELPDLVSRLQGTTTAAIKPPDDMLLSAVLIKLFADRQLTPNPNLIPFLLNRMDRSFTAAIELVAKLDAQSIAQARPVTRQLAAKVLDKAT